MPKKKIQINATVGVNLKRIRANYVTITSDCQKADPPTAASKYMRMMKICTSVTSMLGGRKSRDVTKQLSEVCSQQAVDTQPPSTVSAAMMVKAGARHRAPSEENRAAGNRKSLMRLYLL